MAKKEKKSEKFALLLGVGLDGKDGHRRVTKGENFLLVGGSKDTHEQMQDKAIGFNEELRRRGRRLEDIGRNEFREIADRVGMNIVPHED